MPDPTPIGDRVPSQERTWKDYVQHKWTCAKWGEVWEYPRRLHAELACTCGLDALLASTCQQGQGTSGENK